MKLSNLFLISAIFSLFITMGISIVGQKEVVIGETPCVDGLNRVNLEGLMCEEMGVTFFGADIRFSYLLFIPSTLFLMLSIVFSIIEAKEEYK